MNYHRLQGNLSIVKNREVELSLHCYAAFTQINKTIIIFSYLCFLFPLWVNENIHKMFSVTITSLFKKKKKKFFSHKPTVYYFNNFYFFLHFLLRCCCMVELNDTLSLTYSKDYPAITVSQPISRSRISFKHAGQNFGMDLSMNPVGRYITLQ